MDLSKEQGVFMSRLCKIIPAEYILGHEWLDTIDWQQTMKQSFDLELQIDKNMNLNLFPWEGQKTHAFISYKDICNLSQGIKSEIQEYIGDELSCYLFFDFLEEGDFSTTLKLEFIPGFIFDIGIIDIVDDFNYAGLHHSFDRIPFLIFSKKTKHCIWLDNIDEPMFTTFSLVSLESNQRAAQIKIEIALMDYIEEHFSSYYEGSSKKLALLERGANYFYDTTSLISYIDRFLDDLCDFCLYDSKYDYLQKSWGTSKSLRTKKEEQKKSDFSSFVYDIYYLLSEIQQHILFKDFLVDIEQGITLAEFIKQKKRSWHSFYMDGLGGPDFEDHFMIFSDIMEY